jgi:K+-sensing histidine kinase KdpD
VPAFEPADGRFAGYRGVARREEAMPPPAGSMPPPAPARDHDSLRELVHEIKTPLNAIIGFAEIIDGQYLGPAHRSYRQRAAEIVSQARTLLGAIDDLDFAAKLQSSRSSPGEGTDFAEILPQLTEEFAAYAAVRGAEISTRLESAFHRCALDAELSERLIRRFVESVLDVAIASEIFTLGIGSERGNCALTITRPAVTMGVTEEQLFDPAFAVSPDDKLGIGFALRLVRGLARIAGGDLRVDTERLVLLLPAVRSA